MYLAVMEDVFKTDDGDRGKEIHRLEKERTEKNDAITKPGETQSDISKLISRIRESNQTEDRFTEYSRYDFSFLSDIKTYYEQADLDTKQKIVGLIFPEKLCFSDGTYRTSKPSEVFSLNVLDW